MKLFKWLPTSETYVNLYDMATFSVKDSSVTAMMTNGRLFTFEDDSDDYTAFVAGLGLMFELVSTDTLPEIMIWGGPLGMTDEIIAGVLSLIEDARA